MVIAILSVVLLILVLLLFTPAKAVLKFGNDGFSLNVLILGLKVYSLKKTEKNIPASPEEKAEKFKKDTEKLTVKLKNILELCRFTARLMKKYATVDDVTIKIAVGTGDAATTAISTGALWAAVYNALGILGRIMYITNHKVEITPDYVAASFNTDGKCIIKSRVVYIIIIVISILFKIKSLKEE